MNPLTLGQTDSHCNNNKKNMLELPNRPYKNYTKGYRFSCEININILNCVTHKFFLFAIIHIFYLMKDSNTIYEWSQTGADHCWKHKFSLKSKLIQFIIHKILNSYLHIKLNFILIVSANGIVFDIGIIGYN